MTNHILILGNGIAGLTAADSLRGAGFEGEVTIVGDEVHQAYSRPALSKALLAPQADLGSHHLPAPTHGASEILGLAACALDVDRQVVTLSDGADLHYDRLVIATGSRARRLSSYADEVTLRSLDDALVLRERLLAAPEVVVIGGGALGMEIASGALNAGCAVTLVSQGAPLVAQLGKHLSQLFVAAAQRQGLRIIETAEASIAREGGQTVVVLASGERLPAGLVVSAVGDLPNTEWLASSGLLAPGAVGGPLIADSRGLVRPEIAAVGDVAAFPTAQGIRRIPLWTSAIEQAKVAAAALLGVPDAPPLAFQSYFWTEGFGLNLKAIGQVPAAGNPTYLVGSANESSGHGLMRWAGDAGAEGAAVALNHKIPIPRLRKVLAGVPV